MPRVLTRMPHQGRPEHVRYLTDTDDHICPSLPRCWRMAENQDDHHLRMPQRRMHRRPSRAHFMSAVPLVVEDGPREAIQRNVVSCAAVSRMSAHPQGR